MAVNGKIGSITVVTFAIKSIWWSVTIVDTLLVLTFLVSILVARRDLNRTSRAVEVRLSWVRISGRFYALMLLMMLMACWIVMGLSWILVYPLFNRCLTTIYRRSLSRLARLSYLLACWNGPNRFLRTSMLIGVLHSEQDNFLVSGSNGLLMRTTLWVLTLLS